MGKPYKRHTFWLLTLSLSTLSLMLGCSRKVMPSVTTNTQDSVRIEYRETVREVPVEIPIPVEVRVAIIRPDTTSVLQTSLALSTASLIEGWLHHSLENRQDNKPVIEIPVKDTQTTEYEFREVIKNVPYPVKIPLSWWKKLRMDFGGWALAAMLIILIWGLIKRLIVNKF